MRKLPREPGWHLLGDVPLPLIAVLLSIATHKRRWLFSCAAVQEDDRTGKISYSHKSCRSKSKWIILFSEYFEDLLSVVGQTRGAEPYCRIQAFTPTVSCPFYRFQRHHLQTFQTTAVQTLHLTCYSVLREPPQLEP